MSSTAYSRREREVMDILYRLGRGGVSDVRAEMPSPPSYSAVRALMGTMVDKGYLTRSPEGRAYIYAPKEPVAEARTSALRRVVSSFFHGSAAKTAVALVELDALSPDDLSELKAAIARAEQEGR